MQITSLDTLKHFCSDCEDLWELLCQYTGLVSDVEKQYPWEDIYDDLCASDTLWAMADQNDMKESDMVDWLKDHLETSVQCRVFQECGPAGGWPVVEVQCLDMVFYLDWVLD